MKPICNRFGLVLVLSLSAIGCTQPNTGDPQAAPIGVTDTNRFWLFPNPGRDPATGVYTTNDASYAQAYYDAIDPLDQRATLNGFKATNGFGTTVAGMSEVNVIFRNVKDLGYGRKMTVRFSDPGAVSHTVAVFVENYQVVPFVGVNYSRLNLEAAITANANYHVGTNAIEYTTAPNGLKFAKFYTYAPGTGARLNTVNLDGRGQKAMPSVCINCHGGRVDPLLTFDATVVAGPATTRFPNGGYVKARMQPIDVGSVEFWSTAPYRRIDQEEALRQINYALFCTHSLPTGAVPAGLDTCRPVPPQGHDYQGAAAEMMKDWYAPAASGLNTPNTPFADSYVPAGWSADAAQISLYTNVVKPYCRVCHQLRGTENLPQDDIDFTSYAKFSSYADRIEHHVFDRGNMPLGLLIYNQFWSTSAPEQLADFLTTVNPAYNPARVGGAATGRPVQPKGALTDPTFLVSPATTTPTYAAFAKPTTFATIKGIIQNTNTVGCTGCHLHPSNAIPVNTYGVGFPGYPPIAYDNYDRDGVGGIAATPADDYEFYRALRGRMNLTDFLASPLLRKPTGNQHGGGKVLQKDVGDINYATACAASPTWPSCQPFATYGDYSQAVYNTFLDWIEHGAPYTYTSGVPDF